MILTAFRNRCHFGSSALLLAKQLFASLSFVQIHRCMIIYIHRYTHISIYFDICIWLIFIDTCIHVYIHI